MTLDNDLQVKKLILESSNGGRSWTAEFEGRITRRDIARLNRVITVEFAKAQRKRSVERLRERGHLFSQAQVEEVTNEVQPESETRASKEQANVYKPK